MTKKSHQTTSQNNHSKRYHLPKTFILQINAGITRGGAARVLFNIHKGITFHEGITFHDGLKNNFCAKIATQGTTFLEGKIPNDKTFLSIPKKNFDSPCNIWEKTFFSLCKKTNRYIGKIKGAGFLTNTLFNIGRPTCFFKNIRGIQNFENFPGTKTFFDNLHPFPDIIHCHNLHGKYFDLRLLPELSQKVPVVLTLHDEWMYTGHCACTLGCNKWQNAECKKCPDLKRYEALWRDSASYNFTQKKLLYKKSNLFVIAPSKWILDRAKKSILAPAIKKSKVIHNGIDLSIFKPKNKLLSRAEKNLPQDATILLFVASQAKTNEYKDYETLEKAIFHVAEKNPEKSILFLCIGERGEIFKKNNLVVKYIDYVENEHELAAYYQAADIFTYATRADTFPTTVIEALACGLPVIGTNIGGIPEQVTEKLTGMLYKEKDHQDLAEKIEFLLQNRKIREEMGENAHRFAKKHFDVKKQVAEYIDFYNSIRVIFQGRVIFQ